MRLVPGLIAVVLVLSGLLSGCGGEDYCDTVKDRQADLTDVTASGSAAALLDALPIFRDLADEAPDDIRDEWRTFLDPLEELENVFAALKEAKPIAAVRTPPKSLATPVAPPATPPVAAPVRTEAQKPSPAASPVPPAPYATEATATPSPADEEEFESFSRDERAFQNDAIGSDAFDEGHEPRRRSYGGLIAAAVALLVLGGGGYGIWLNKDEFGQMLGLNQAPLVVLGLVPGVRKINLDAVETAIGDGAGQHILGITLEQADIADLFIEQLAQQAADAGSMHFDSNEIQRRLGLAHGRQ